MSITVQDALLSKSRGTPEQVFAFFEKYPPLKPEEAKKCVNEAFRLAPLTGLDFSLIIARMGDETGDLNGPGIFRSVIWNERLGSGGLGVTDGVDENWVFASGVESARATVSHMLLYATGNIAKGGLSPDLDPRYSAYRGLYGESAAAKTLFDLEGKWFTQVGGAQNTANRGNNVFPGLPNQGADMSDLNMTKGLVPMVAYEDSLVLDGDNDAWDNLGQRTVRGIVLHRMLGGWRSTGDYFKQHAQGLTDFGQDANTGQVLRWTDPTGAAHPGVSPNKSPWASGPLSAPYGDGLAFFNKYGINAINRDQASWEISGNYGDPWSLAAMMVAAQACAHFAHDYGISYIDFPISKDGFSFVRWHQEFTIGSGKVCPGNVVMAQTAQFIELVRAILKKYQTGEIKPADVKPAGDLVYAAPIIPSFLTEDLKSGAPHDHLFEAVQYHAVRRKFTTIKATRRLQSANNSSKTPVVGPLIPLGETFEGWYTFSDGKRAWVLTAFGTRVLARDLNPKISVKLA